MMVETTRQQLPQNRNTGNGGAAWAVEAHISGNNFRRFANTEAGAVRFASESTSAFSHSEKGGE
jgi:hypothetical protein